jgi:hypothetical protein
LSPRAADGGPWRVAARASTRIASRVARVLGRRRRAAASPSGTGRGTTGSRDRTEPEGLGSRHVQTKILRAGDRRGVSVAERLYCVYTRHTKRPDLERQLRDSAERAPDPQATGHRATARAQDAAAGLESVSGVRSGVNGEAQMNCEEQSGARAWTRFCRRLLASHEVAIREASTSWTYFLASTSWTYFLGASTSWTYLGKYILDLLLGKYILDLLGQVHLGHQVDGGLEGGRRRGVSALLRLHRARHHSMVSLLDRERRRASIT